MSLKIRPNKSAIAAILLILSLGVWAAFHLKIGTISQQSAPVPENGAAGAAKVPKGLDELPKEADFQTVAQNDMVELKLDAKTGHFLVYDKRNGNIWRSYPDPSQWPDENQDGVWRTHLRSPIMFQYIDLSNNKSQPKESNFLEENGSIKDVQMIPDGFRLTFDMPSRQIAVPIEVKIDKDSVVTRIIDSGVKEGRMSLVWMRLYPFFGAEHSAGQDGYMLIPDGSGALIRYGSNDRNGKSIYSEPIYGQDLSFKVNNLDGSSSRKQVVMPIFGAKSGNRAYLSVVEDGAEFAEIVASPAGVFSGFNWITSQQDYRSSYKQVTNQQTNRSFIAYNKDNRFGSDRVVRYLLLDTNKADYAGMAERYRQYLIDNYGLKKIRPKSGDVPMTVNLVGGELEKGLFTDKYLKATTTDDAMHIVQSLRGLGIGNMVVNYLGWQGDGYSSYGGLFPVDRRIGGNDGMNRFISFAHSLNVLVYLQADYTLNTTGADGFLSLFHGLRDAGGTVLKPYVSLNWLMGHVLDRDIRSYKGLGADGVTMAGIGAYVNSDYNSKYGASRDESRKLHQEILKKFQAAGLEVRGLSSNFFALPFVSTIDHLADDYSYDVFSGEGIPFAQMALHGLISYTSEDGNNRQQYQNGFLHDLEYGSEPSFVFAYRNTAELKYANELHIFNPDYAEWEKPAVEEYKKYNDALGDVQSEFIVNHRSLAPQVKETTFENGKRIIVNYGPKPYTDGKRTVDPEDYLVIEGGAKQ
ncbi:DUF5696 domain-containing protein [Paenibacillus filicis]|uniref:DUF5696 domain-containing protein n=1 Tax=Paenibacillus gyeongsangnamensis TaxID=3388067 RepID=A0ABT4Q459_9BACL|nr:DUF5696 domain-containing protein [Paenibacillus filicis]MCZ8511637.1 DUF5696 domain-containing protein [Paenibacillus filicis]